MVSFQKREAARNHDGHRRHFLWSGLHTTVLNWASNCIFTSQRVLSLPHKFVIAKFRMAGKRRLGERAISDSEPSCSGGGADLQTGYGGRLTCHERLSEDK